MSREYGYIKTGKRLECKERGGSPEKFPGLSQNELDAANALFQHYVFYKTEGAGRRIWTSCCHVDGKYIEAGSERMQGPGWFETLWGQHNYKIRCPFCREKAELKCVGKIGDGKKLTEYQPVVFLHVSRGGKTVYAQGYWAKKEYFKGNTETLCAYPQYMVTRVYRFRRGEAIRWELHWNGGWSMKENGFCEEPFLSGGLYHSWDRYTVIGWERLEKSFLRYTGWEKLREVEEQWIPQGETRAAMRWLFLAAQYPEQTEMLMKNGMYGIVKDWIYAKCKNAAAMKWGESDPRKAFGLNSGELKAWIASGGDPNALVIRKLLAKIGERADIARAVEITQELVYPQARQMRKLMGKAKQWHIPEKQVLHYLMAQRGGCHMGGGYRTLQMVLDCWSDYVEAAEALGMELWKKKVLCPGNLWAEHDRVTAERSRKTEALRKKAEHERAEKERLAYEERRKELQEKYAFTMDGLSVVVPASAQEITDEGRILCHCVGGYADRHIKGITTILFLRDVENPQRPYLTIEMNGNKLVQIHGYRNEGLYSTQGRFAPDPKETHKEWLDTWLKWLSRGSKRKRTVNHFCRR